MSKELEELEKRAAQEMITDPAEIGRIISYLLSLPFTYLLQDKKRYIFIRSEICNGFHVYEADLEGLSLEEILMIMRHMRERIFYTIPDVEIEEGYEELSCAPSSFALAMAIWNLSYKDIRIKEFIHIEMTALADYLYQRSTGFGSKGEERSRYKMDRFIQTATSGRFGWRYHEAKHRSWPSPTVGDLLSKALEGCRQTWIFYTTSWESYRDGLLNSYGTLCWFFLNFVREPTADYESDRVRRIVRFKEQKEE
ncbi:MAG: hypothetical protein IJP92_14100 [Lachnospiraceae bacterium]|nr:hypothetical protein [Lachnospiraceae bacterium]